MSDTIRPIMGSVDEMERLRRHGVLESRIRATLPRVPGFNERLLRDDSAMNQLLWIADSQSWAIKFNSPLEGRVTPPSFGDAELLALLREIVQAVPALQLNPVTVKEPPKEWVWSEFDGETLSNPFAKETENKSDAMWLQQNFPELASFLKRQAEGGPSYKELHEQREQERLRRESLTYRGSNPWRESEQDMTLSERTVAKAEIKKKNPLLAETLEAESRGVIANPWTGAGHVTRQLEITRDFPALVHLFRLAAVHETAQLQRELDQAKARAAEAQFRAVQAGR